MKTPAFFTAAVLAAGIALGVAGCASQPTIAGSHVASGRPARTFALAVTLPDGSQLTPQQWAIVKATFQAQLATAGLSLVDDLSLADRIIRVVYTPAEDDPTNGNAVVMSVRPNPVYAYNTGLSYSPAYASMNPYNFFGYGYNSFNNYDTYSYLDTSYTSGSPRIDHPNHSRPNHPVDCPPDTNGANQHASNRGHGDGDGDHGQHRSWPSSDGGSRSGGYTRADSGYPSSSYSTPSSSSLSYSGGSSSSYNSPSSSSFSSGSSSYSSPSSSSFSSGSSSSYSAPASSSYSAPSSSDFSSSSSSSSSSGNSSPSPVTNQSAN
jgi:hypothetical protein